MHSDSHYNPDLMDLSRWGLNSHPVLYCALLSPVRPFATPWTIACQAPLSMGILQARILEWVAMPLSRKSSQSRDQAQVSCIVGRFFTDWATREAQEYWRGQPIPIAGDLLNLGTERGSPALQVDYQLSYQWSPPILYLSVILNSNFLTICCFVLYILCC